MQLKWQRISIEMMQEFSIKIKIERVLVILSEQNILIGTKRIELDKNYFTKTKFSTADQLFMEVDKPQPKNNPRTITLSQIDGKII